MARSPADYRPKHSTIRALTAALAISASTLTLQSTGQAHAQQATATSFSIPAGPLSQVLSSFGRQSGLQVTYMPSVATGHASPGVSGSMTADKALAHLLQGSGLAFSFTNSTTVAISAQPASVSTNAGDTTTLQPIVLETSSATTEGSNSYGSGLANVAGKDATSIKETPQSVSVVTRKRIDDQNLTALDKIVANTTGMTVQQGDSGRPTYYARGFPVDTFQIDGVPTALALPASPQDTAMYDRAEVLRGPSGLLNGLGSPGGTINLVRKLPMDEFHFSDELSGGSYNDLRNVFDVTGPLNEDKSLRGRLVGTLQTQDFITDDTFKRLGQIYGVLEGDLTDNTTVRVGGYYQRSRQRLNYVGSPATTDYKFLDTSRSTYFGAPWNYGNFEQDGAFAEVEHQFDNGWSTKATVNYLRYKWDGAQGYVNGAVDPATLTAPITYNSINQNDQQIGLDWYATGPVEAFGRTHKFTFGFDASHEDLAQWNYYGPSDDLFYSETRNVFDIDVPEPAFDGPVYGRHTLTNQFGAFANARISLADPLTLVLGGRLLWWNSRYNTIENENPFGDTPTNDSINGKPIPFAGLVYDLNKTYSVYGSYASIFQPQTTRNTAGELLKPIEGDQYEVGIKGSFLDDRLMATLSVFRIKQQNRAILDPSDPTGTIYFADGEARSEGIDAEISGEIQDGWNVFAGYTYTNTKNLDSSDNTDYQAFSSIAPKHLFRLWTSYELPGRLDKWTIGGGMNATSNFYNEDSGGKLVAAGYATFGAMASYKFTEHLTGTVNVDNIFDRKYIRSINGTANGFYGDPRTVFVKLKASW